MEQIDANPTRRSRNRLTAVSIVFILVLSLLASDGMLRSVALVSAGIEFPQGASSLLTDNNPGVLTPPRITRRQHPAAQPVANNDIDLTETPSDILLLMEEALIEFADQVRDGDIVPRTYTVVDATHHWGSLTVRNTTETQSDRDVSQDLATPIDLEIDKEQPAILIFHTHTTEGFEILNRPWYAADWNSRTQNSHRNIVRVGEAMVQVLERAGFVVIHDTTIFDVPFAGAYDRSRAAVQEWLERYPSIQVTLDVHRDAIHRSNGERIKPVAEIHGKQAAQVMIITGIEEGRVAQMPGGFPNWEQNLAFAARLHVAAEERHPGLMIPIFFCPRRYNMDLTPFSLLLEVGADANTLQEAVYSGKLLGDAIAAMLENYVV